jgi:hypothetical protein
MNAEEGYCREVVPLFNFNSKFSSFLFLADRELADAIE